MRHHNSGYLVHNGGDHHRTYSTDGEESHPGISIRESSEYAVPHKSNSMLKPVTAPVQKNNRLSYEKESEKRHGLRNGRGYDYSRDSPPNVHRQNGFGSEIYVSNGATSDISRHHSPVPSSRIDDRAPSNYSYGSGRSGGSTVKTKTSRHGGIVVETMSTPNPFCPNTKGMCCLLLLLNLGLILVTLGFVIVIQFFEPFFVWILGIVFLIFGMMTLVGSLIYCVHVFKNAKHPHDVNPEDLYWTRYWQGHVGSAPEIHYKADDKYPDDGASDRYSKYSTNYSDRNSHRY